MLKQPKISDISALFHDDLIEDMEEDDLIINEDGSIELPVFLWYRSNELFDIEAENEKINAVFDECFEYFDFPEYKLIGSSIYNYITNNDYDTEHLIVNVMVDEKSKFAKGYEDHTGFIRLFTLIFHDSELTHLRLNMHLITEKIELTVQPEKKEFFEEKDEDDNIVNDDKCVICLSNKGKLVETPCHHKYHLNCIRQTPKLICPLCKTNLIDFLTKNDVTKEEIEFRIKDEERENELADFNDALGMIDYDEMMEMDDIEFARLCLENLRLHNGTIIPYSELLLDMIRNASHLFGEISRIKSKKEKGAFVYLFETPMEFIIYNKNQDMPGMTNWIPLKTFQEAPFYDHIEAKLDQITDPSKQFAVIIILEKMVNVKIIDTDASDTCFRLSEQDILTSLIRCNVCRCSGDTPTAPNKEYRWARMVLNNMKRKHKKNMLRYQNKKTREHKIEKNLQSVK